MATPNGVIDFETMQFREGRPEDYISLCTDVYFREFEDDDPLLEEIRDFFKALFPDDDTRKWIIGALSRSLVGPREEVVYLFTGSGSNGKVSLVMDSSVECAFPTDNFSSRRVDSFLLSKTHLATTLPIVSSIGNLLYDLC